MRASHSSGRLRTKCAVLCSFSYLSILYKLSAILLVFWPLLIADAVMANTDEGVGPADAARGLYLLPGDIFVGAIDCQYSVLYPGQRAVPIRVDVSNGSETFILIQFVNLFFSAIEPGDRSEDYAVYGDIMPNVIIPPGNGVSFHLLVDVRQTAVTDVGIRVDAIVTGQRQDNLELVRGTTGGGILRDEFRTISYSGNDGTVRWSNNWQEIGEADGPAFGDVRVTMSPYFGMGNSLRIGDLVGFQQNQGASREADLSGALSANVTFDYLRDNLKDSDIWVQVSGNGGFSWTTVRTIPHGSDASPRRIEEDIFSYVSSNTQIRFITEKVGSGYIYLDNVQIEYVDDTRSHYWMVLSEYITAIGGLFHTRNTPYRDDDSLIVYFEDNFFLNEIHYLDGGKPLADIALDDTTFYRLVLQLNPSVEWEYEPKEPERGFLAFADPASGFGRRTSPQPDLREFLLSDFFVPDEEIDPSDFVLGATRNSNPANPWDMVTNPWIDPNVDGGRTREVASVTTSSPPIRWILDCVDGGAHWEVTGKCENDRYYFYELWFQPDLEWSPGDIADMYLHIFGKPEPKDIDELHLLFNMVDDDTLGPVFSDFSPEIVSETESFYITCRISDPSGIYDDDTGSGEQGVYLLWDNDGSLLDDANELQMSSIGGGYFRTDTPIGSQTAGEVVIYRVFACDNDFDGFDPQDRSCSSSTVHTVQILGTAYLFDEPGSLYPSSVYPGQEGIAFHIDCTNPMSYSITLETTSSLSFSDGNQIVTAFLGNVTLLYPEAKHFTLSFIAVDIPPDFSAPDTLDLTFDFHGTDFFGNPFDQTWRASETNRIIVLEPRILLEAHAIPAGTVFPGDRRVELLRVEASNDSPGAILLDSLVVTNVTSGSWEVPHNDVNMSRLYLYRQSSLTGSLLFEQEEFDTERVPSTATAKKNDRDASVAGEERKVLGDDTGLGSDTGPVVPLSRPFDDGDSLVATALLEEGNVKFNLSKGRLLPAGHSLFYYVLADVDSFLACDRDSLDLAIVSPDSIFITGSASVSLEHTPLNSEGRCVIDGFVSFQLSLGEALPETLYSGDPDQLVLEAVIPVNGYAPDILSGISVRNYGDGDADDLVQSLKLWVDDGDSVFSSQADILLGELHRTGDLFEVSGLSYPVIEPQRLFVSADFMHGFNREMAIHYGVPREGIRYLSGNDGPIEIEALPTTSQILIRREIISLSALPIEAEHVYPGDTEVELFALEISNNTLGLVTLDSMWVRDDLSLFSCEPDKVMQLYLDDGDASLDTDLDTLITSSLWNAGNALFNDINVDIESEADAVLYLVTDLDSFLTVDGETLVVGLESENDIYFTLNPQVVTESYLVDASFPLFSEGGKISDGMLAHQVLLHPYGDSTIVDVQENILVLDVEVPGNGCMNETLFGFTVANYGTADDTHIDRVLLWRDDGDGQFDPLLDDYLAEFATVAVSIYQVGGISVPLPGSTGERLFVTVNLCSNIKTGATIKFGIPAMGIEVASGNDGPIDGDIVSEGSLIIPVPNRVTFFTSILGNKRVYPGQKAVLNLVIGAYNSYDRLKTLESLALLNTGSSLPSEITGLEAFADTDGNGLFNPAQDSLLGTAELNGLDYLFDALNLTLRSHQNSLIFIAYSLPLEGIRDSVKVDFQVSNSTAIGFKEGVAIDGYFPLNSAGEDITDGMVAAQIDVFDVEAARVSPGEIDVPCFSFQLPCNGTLEDRRRSR